MTCVICLFDTINLLYCVFCLKSCCNQCIKQNKDRCCHCNYNDSMHEFNRQLDIIKSDLTNNKLYYANQDIKPCPVCKTLIEKEATDCCQIFCIICETIWSWENGQVYNNICKRDVHNINYHTNVSVRCDNDLITKSLEKLYKEEYKYAVDTFIIRMLFTNDTLSFQELKDRILARYKIYKRHLSIRIILINYINNTLSIDECVKQLRQFGSDLVIGKLPWT